MMGTIISNKPELVGPLNTVLGTEDLHDIIEVIIVDAHNQQVANKKNKETD